MFPARRFDVEQHILINVSLNNRLDIYLDFLADNRAFYIIPKLLCHRIINRCIFIRRYKREHEHSLLGVKLRLLFDIKLIQVARENTRIKTHLVFRKCQASPLGEVSASTTDRLPSYKLTVRVLLCR